MQFEHPKKAKAALATLLCTVHSTGYVIYYTKIKIDITQLWYSGKKEKSKNKRKSFVQ